MHEDSDRRWAVADDQTFYAEIPGFDCVFANADTRTACTQQFEEVPEDWILLGIAEGHPLPEVAGIVISVKKSA